MDRCKYWVTFNANVTIPAGSDGCGSGISGGSEAPGGFRFEYSWKSGGPDVVPDASGRKHSGFPPASLVRNNSSSGYGSEQRCRSTCSITLKTGIPEFRPEAEPELVETPPEAPDCPHRAVRRASESEAWDFRQPEENGTFSRKPIPGVSGAAALHCKQKTSGRKAEAGSRKKVAQRPRTVHIDVYCTDSDSQSESGTNSQPEAGSDSEQSTTSSCYTVVRPGFRHIRKKKGLPNAMTSASGERKLPILSYRISGKDLADAIERKRRQSSSVDTMDEDLFRNATLTDSSILWADSDAESVACSNSSFDNPPHPPPEALKKSWRSPEDERRRKRMLELRKEQWRASKAAEALPAAIHPPPNASAPSMAHLSIRTTDSLDNSCASGRSVSPRVSPRVSRVPTMLIRPPSGGELRSKSLSASIPARPIRIPAKVGKKADESEMPWQWRNRPDYIRTHPVTLKKFGHHVGPSRNPECGCVHCVEYHRVRSLKNPN